MSKLVIAEKPSVANSIADVLGANQREDGYREGNGYIVSWCVGHLIELMKLEDYDESLKKWTYESLPIIPGNFQYEVKRDTKKQYGILKKLMHCEDVKSIVCATDAGREGEHIFRLVFNQAKCNKPIERLWISSMEERAILDGFKNLRPGSDYDCLYQSALARQKADWLVGINGTRLFTVLYNGKMLRVGRVQTLPLMMEQMTNMQQELINMREQNNELMAAVNHTVKDTICENIQKIEKKVQELHVHERLDAIAKKANEAMENLDSIKTDVERRKADKENR